MLLPNVIGGRSIALDGEPRVSGSEMIGGEPCTLVDIGGAWRSNEVAISSASLMLRRRMSPRRSRHPTARSEPCRTQSAETLAIGVVPTATAAAQNSRHRFTLRLIDGDTDARSTFGMQRPTLPETDVSTTARGAALTGNGRSNRRR
jgi:hypothetical protein